MTSTPHRKVKIAPIGKDTRVLYAPEEIRKQYEVPKKRFKPPGRKKLWWPDGTKWPQEVPCYEHYETLWREGVITIDGVNFAEQHEKDTQRKKLAKQDPAPPAPGANK